jgi:hypothetical protein
MVVLIGSVSSLGYGQVGVKAVGSLFLEETGNALTKNLSKTLLMDDVSIVIAQGLEKVAASSVLKNPQIQPLTKIQVWPDEIEARYVLSAYLRGNVGPRIKVNPKSDFYVHTSVSLTPEKYIYKRMSDEKRLYQPEIDAAFDMFSILYRSNISQTIDSPAIKQQVKEFIDTQVISKDLRKYLEKSLQEGNMSSVLGDISDYYGIETLNEADAAIKFFERHPHGRTLALKRALHSPFTPNAIKKELRGLLQKSKLTAAEKSTLREQLKQLFIAQNSLYEEVLTAESINEQKQMLMSFADKLDSFLTKKGAMPRWDSSELAERKLASEWVVICNSRKWDDFGTLHSYYALLDQVLNKFGIAQK